MLARIREITGGNPTLKSLAENPQLGDGAGSSRKGRGVDRARPAYLNRVLEANGLQAAKTREEAIQRIKALPFETELNLEEAEKSA